MTDKKNPNPPLSIFTEIPPHPDIHGVSASPVYTLAGDTLPTLGTQPAPRAPVAAGGGAAGATSKKPQRKNTGVPAMMTSPYCDSDGTKKPADIPVALQPTTGAVMDVGIVDTIMASCQKDRKDAINAVDSYFSLKGNERLTQVRSRIHSHPDL